MHMFFFNESCKLDTCNVTVVNKIWHTLNREGATEESEFASKDCVPNEFLSLPSVATEASEVITRRSRHSFLLSLWNIHPLHPQLPELVKLGIFGPVLWVALVRFH